MWLRYIWYRIKIRWKINTVPTPTVPPPPSPLRKHQESQASDGQTGSWCLDKAVLARDARYQARSNDISHG